MSEVTDLLKEVLLQLEDYKQEISRLNTRIVNLKRINEELVKNLDQANLKLAFLNQRTYSPKTEKSSEDNEGLFKILEEMGADLGSCVNEIEVTADPLVKEKEYDEIIPLKKQRKFPNKRIIDFGAIVKQRVDHGLSDLKCQRCGTKYKIIGEEIIRVVEYIPGKYVLKEHHYPTYACPTCEKITGEANIIKCPKSPRPFGKSYAGASLVSNILTNKFVMHVPLYRQQQDLNSKGIMFSRQSMSNWCARASLIFRPLYNLIIEELLRQKIIHADETTLKVINYDIKEDSRSKSYEWTFMDGKDDDHLIYYVYDKTRSSKVPKLVLSGYRGYLMTDGYGGYNNLTGVTQLLCMAHLRRKFVDINKTLKKPNEDATKFINYINALYHIEHQIEEQNIPYDLIVDFRIKNGALKIKQSIFDLYNSLVSFTPSEFTLGKALGYLGNSFESFFKYIELPFADIDNNRCERDAIKPFVMGRKNWLFANTEKGARDTSVIISLIQSARMNGVNVNKYLNYLFEHFEEINHNNKNLKKFLPYRSNFPEFIVKKVN